MSDAIYAWGAARTMDEVLQRLKEGETMTLTPDEFKKVTESVEAQRPLIEECASLRAERDQHVRDLNHLAAENMELGLEVERLRAALEKLAEEHEDQAEAWGNEEGDMDNSRYHAKLAKIAREALREEGK